MGELRQLHAERSSTPHSDLACRAAQETGLQTNFESTFGSSFYANLYRLSGLHGGHVIMLGADFASRCEPV